MAFQEQVQKALVQSVTNLLGTMIPMNFKAVDGPTAIDGEQLLGMIQVNGQINGSIAVSMPNELAITMTGLLLDEDMDDLNDDVYETIAEMINIIAGSVKTNLSRQEEVFQLGLPQVLELRSQRKMPEDNSRVIVPIETEQGHFIVLSTLYESAAHGHAS